MHAIYPISGDPPTLGHLDIIERASQVFTEVTWALAINPRKTYLCNHALRLAMLEVCVKKIGRNNIRIASYEGSTARYAEKIGANVVIKGLRNSTDMQAEMEQAFGNRRINSSLDTISFFARSAHLMISSSLARELALLGESLERFVLPEVETMLKAMLSHPPTSSA